VRPDRRSDAHALAAALARHGRELPADISGTLDRLDGWAREARATVMARPAHY
jgi:hypothetical protein